ncbi:spore germination protein B1 [Ruminiclostridium hungatei]|uniref:Spore germination protein B1 n=1 Tax=Ruminiclostridium hungatei TaxID=48256 RepID=A0A1V4SPS9_RUMHU|nr:spore germination protein [Ruminiclostridium hungatei]OPX45908.1 spore germination protein B1 [Ruminiclostridium hungatei]
MAEKNRLKSLFALLTYKKPKNIETFYIPETEEETKRAQEIKGMEHKARGIKKPRLVSEMSKKRERGLEKDRETYRFKYKEKSKDGASKGRSGNSVVDKQVSVNIDENMGLVKKAFNSENNKDIIIREFTVGGQLRAFIAYMDGMVDRTTINDFIIKPLLAKKEYHEGECSLDKVIQQVLQTNQANKITDTEEMIYEILVGNTCLFIEGCNYCISSETKGFEKRSVSTPQTEGVVRGSQEGFTENLRTNVTLVRKIIKNKDLSTEFLKIGARNNNQCAVMYIDGLINPAIVAEVKRRITSLKTDFIAGSGILEQFIEENPWSIIPTIISTERPDKAASHLIEGKAVIIADGTPFALIVPVSLTTMFHTPEDTTLRWQYGTLLRFIRIFAVFIAIFIPGLYVALTNFHREMIPTDLLIAIAKARENVPFPTILEVMLMEVSFELIREAGIRIPGIIGNTIGIIGALILGQAAVQANLVSPVLIIIVAITGLGNFAIPDFSVAFAARIMRLIYIVLGAFLGFYGISLGIVVFTVMLACTKSFGVPMLNYFAPKLRNSNDIIIRRPVWMQELRPDNINPLDITRQPEISRKWVKEPPAENMREDSEEAGEDDRKNE